MFQVWNVNQNHILVLMYGIFFILGNKLDFAYYSYQTIKQKYSLMFSSEEIQILVELNLSLFQSFSF